jgi:P27 family predicted phage terminase small subunit
MTGRRPKPTPLKLLAGVRASRINHAEPVIPAGAPEAPEGLDAVARAEFARMSALLAPVGVLTRADAPTLALYASAYSRWVEAERRVRETGLVLKTKNGLVSNPYVRVARDASHVMLKILIELGCTPSSRSRVRVSDTRPRETLDDFLVTNR